MHTIIADFLQENTSQEVLTESASVVHEMLKRKPTFQNERSGHMHSNPPPARCFIYSSVQYKCKTKHIQPMT